MSSDSSEIVDETGSASDLLTTARRRLESLNRIRDQVTSGIRVVGPIERNSIVMIPDVLFHDDDDPEGYADRLNIAMDLMTKMLGHKQFTVVTYNPDTEGGAVVVHNTEAMREIVSTLLGEILDEGNVILVPNGATLDRSRDPNQS